MFRILYVDDNPTAREYVHKGLSERGFSVDVACDGQQGLDLARAGPYDFLIVDVMLPRLDGFELLRRLREAGVETPILFLSVRGEPGDRIEGLNLGADDYLSKPFAFAELVARIRAIARRSRREPLGGVLRTADLTLDLDRHRVTRGGRPVELTPKEFGVLELLMRHAGQVVSRAMIAESVWGYGFESYSNVIDVHINRLRRKVDQEADFRLLHTVKGVGYVLEDRRTGEDGATEGTRA
jgi:two-component system copper resistance phosphate regulon response regulator CusR